MAEDSATFIAVGGNSKGIKFTAGSKSCVPPESVAGQPGACMQQQGLHICCWTTALASRPSMRSGLCTTCLPSLLPSPPTDSGLSSVLPHLVGFQDYCAELESVKVAALKFRVRSSTMLRMPCMPCTRRLLAWGAMPGLGVPGSLQAHGMAGAGLGMVRW
jgi:hypothetical protein